MGVRLFFVISGFLITGILLRSRDQVEASGQSPLFALRSFYIRRFLRIFPIYYLALLVAWVANVGPARQTLFWHLTYLSNIYTTLTGDVPGALAPYWTLAVEEQFYLVWPWLLLFLPRKYLLPAILTTIVLGPAVRMGGILLDVTPLRVGRLPFACLDTLGLGSLLALASQSPSAAPKLLKHLLRLSLPVGIPLFAVSLLVHVSDFNHLSIPFPSWTGKLSVVTFDLGLALLSVRLVAAAVAGFRGAIGSMLNLPALVYLGGISYGIYVYHVFAQILVLGHLRELPHLPPVSLALLAIVLGGASWAATRSDRSPKRLSQLLSIEAMCAAAASCFLLAGAIGFPSRYVELGVYLAFATGIALALAGISWYLLEQPLLRLKEHFPYARSA
jgi:peptidoglycan/LPS O-acetylase OafA/YrhL